jgi:hypothetical protein
MDTPLQIDTEGRLRGGLKVNRGGAVLTDLSDSRPCFFFWWSLR